MGKYVILGGPMDSKAPTHYRGIYRSEASIYPAIEQNGEMMQLCLKYIDVGGCNTTWGKGVNLTDFSMDELKKLADFHAQYVDSRFEIVYYDFEYNCPHSMEYMGMDVAGIGGYSMIGQGLFVINDSPEVNKWYYLCTALNEYVQAKLNKYALFSSKEDVKFYLGVLKEWKLHFPDHLEDEEWRIYHIYKLKYT